MTQWVEMAKLDILGFIPKTHRKERINSQKFFSGLPPGAFLNE